MSDPTSPTFTYPIRLNRFLALRGLATRRGADQLIKDGQVTLNGKRAILGDVVKTPNDKVQMQKGATEKDYRYVIYYKPRRIISHSPQRGEKSIEMVSGYKGCFPVGRLDKDSEGLILLTDDGRVTERLLHPRFEHEKEYLVSVKEEIRDPRKLNILTQGIIDEGEKLTAKKITLISTKTLCIVLTEGKKHEVRRMLFSLGYTVTQLTRIRIMGLHLGKLKPGEARELHGTSRKSFLKSIGLK
jgi:23S rRNA pseudouridine2604 synthase